MSLITIKFFPEMENAILRGYKCAFVRYSKKELGDIFRIKSRLYRILSIFDIDYDYTCSYFLDLGFKDETELENWWIKNYPSIYNKCKNQQYFLNLHYFAYIGDICKHYNYESKKERCLSSLTCECRHECNNGSKGEVYLPGD